MTRFRAWFRRNVIADAPADMGRTSVLDVAETVRPSRSCPTCGHTPRDESERVVGKCVPGRHEYGLVGWPAPAEQEARIGTVRECRADSLAVLTDEDYLGLIAHMDMAPGRPHEATAAERIGGMR